MWILTGFVCIFCRDENMSHLARYYFVFTQP